MAGGALGWGGMLWAAPADLACDEPGLTGAEDNDVFLRNAGCPESADLDLERVIIHSKCILYRS